MASVTGFSLVLSARTDTAVKVRALELGADDYLTKPFWPEELVARVHARLRRPIARRDGRLELGPLAIDVGGRRVELSGEPVELTRVEFELLLALARRPGAAVQRAWLVEHVLDPEREGGERTLDVHLAPAPQARRDPGGDRDRLGRRLPTRARGARVRLRLRLGLSVLVAAVPVVGLLAWQHRRLERARMRDALEEAHYLTSLVQNLGAAARLEGGAVELVRRPLVLDELVERVLARHRPIAAQKEIALEHALPGEPLTVEAVATLLEQALGNLVHNAVRYGRAGGHVLVTLEERGPHGFSLRVLDDGPGIPPGELARLGERSFRGGDARSRHPDGLGLGLSIAREIAARHGCELRLRPSEQGGLEAELTGPRLST